MNGSGKHDHALEDEIGSQQVKSNSVPSVRQLCIRIFSVTAVRSLSCFRKLMPLIDSVIARAFKLCHEASWQWRTSTAIWHAKVNLCSAICLFIVPVASDDAYSYRFLAGSYCP